MSKRSSLLATFLGVVLLALLTLSGALAQVQNKDQQKCLNKLNKDGRLVAMQQGKENVACVKHAGKGDLMTTAQACLTADPKQRVQAKKDKTIADDTDFCVSTPPNFGYTSASTINSSTVQGELDLTADIFGPDLDAAIIDCDTNGDGCKCQHLVALEVSKLAATKFKEFVKCKKGALDDGGAASSADLQKCVTDTGTTNSIAADTNGKIQVRRDKVNAKVVDKCDTPGVTGAFPGDCDTLTGATLGACLDRVVECRVCTMINEMDNLFVNCDLFDNGAADASCASGTGPSPTPTPTLTPTPTATSTPQPGFQGALGPPTTGLFNYAGAGLPGSDSACNTNFPGSHTCTYAELQTADGLNQLISAMDTNNMAVTSFWAIDSAQINARQCFNSTGMGAAIVWNYQTVHTGFHGDKVPLTAGHLGALEVAAVCSTSSWVGCCI